MAKSYWDSPSLFPIEGGCSCGLIRYALTLPPLIVHACHCLACQRQAGSIMAINAVVESSAITLLPPLPTATRGTHEDTPTGTGLHPAFAALTNSTPATPPTPSTGSTPGASSPIAPMHVTIPSSSQIGVTVAHCPACHTHLWNHYCDYGPHAMYLRLGTLDAPAKIEPDVHIHTKTRRHFITISDGKPQFDEFYEDRSVFYRPETLPRVAALEAQSKLWKDELRKTLTAA